MELDPDSCHRDSSVEIKGGLSSDYTSKHAGPGILDISTSKATLNGSMSNACSSTVRYFRPSPNEIPDYSRPHLMYCFEY